MFIEILAKVFMVKTAELLSFVQFCNVQNSNDLLRFKLFAFDNLTAMCMNPDTSSLSGMFTSKE